MNLLEAGAKIKAEIKLHVDFPEFIWSRGRVLDDRRHLAAAMKWLCLAQDATGCGGVAASYDLILKKWGNPYRETTGYIIPTFLNYAEMTGNDEFRKRALRMGDWEVKDQLVDGSWGEVAENDKSKTPNKNKKVFNTGQVMLGLCTLYDKTGEKKYLTPVVKAAEWLMSIQEKDGRFEKFTTAGARTYHSRVDWPLMEVYRLTGEKKYLTVAINNLNWVLEQQNNLGWFDNCSLGIEGKPWTHLLAYTIRGLWECGRISDNSRYTVAAITAAKKMLKMKLLPGTFDKNWQSTDRYSCLTGNLQIAIVWQKIYQETGEKIYLEAAERIIDLTKKTQVLEGHREAVGAIAGSDPLWGDYCANKLINWATKFFADTIMMKLNPEVRLSG
ncbi:glycoside hydrolase family 127 protein [Candidatus Shapirobacteria bacterium]|nr:glycoside hydrolase family 127 protein [Candidatus Shapirobacteria bacterium]